MSLLLFFYFVSIFERKSKQANNKEKKKRKEKKRNHFSWFSEEPSSELGRTDYIAIGLSLSLTVGIVSFIVFFLMRGRILNQRQAEIETAENPSVDAEAHVSRITRLRYFVIAAVPTVSVALAVTDVIPPPSTRFIGTYSNYAILRNREL